jgi:hypothetical protein
MSEIKIKLDEDNSIRLGLAIQTSDPGQSAKPMVRFMCESEKMSYSFPGTYNNAGEVLVKIPPMQGKISEGVYDARLEVVVDSKYFVPLEIKTRFMPSMKVVAEVIEEEPEQELKTEVRAVILDAPMVEETKAKPKQKVAKKTKKFRSLRDRFNG